MEGSYRRHVTVASRLAAGLLPLALAAPLAAQDGGIAHRELRPGVHLFSGYANGNVLAVAGPDGLLLVDAQSAERVGELEAALRAVTAAPVHRVVNTHYHEDHVGGNAHWRAQGAEVVAHAEVPVQAAKDTVIAEWGNWHRTPLPSAAVPGRLYRDSLTLPGAVLVHPGPAHTDGDTFVLLPGVNVLHVGDVLERGAPPFIDWWAGGSLDGMLAGVDRALALADDRTIIVPGHGDPTDRAGLVRYREMLVDVRDGVEAAARDGADLDAILALQPAAAWVDELGGHRRAAQFVRLVAYGVLRDRAR